jgi:hypothetical protein
MGGKACGRARSVGLDASRAHLAVHPGDIPAGNVLDRLAMVAGRKVTADRAHGQTAGVAPRVLARWGSAAPLRSEPNAPSAPSANDDWRVGHDVWLPGLTGAMVDRGGR